jgi:hypothetical protein
MRRLPRGPCAGEPILRRQYGQGPETTTVAPQSLIMARSRTPQKMKKAVVGHDEN